MSEPVWKLQEGISMSKETAEEVAKMACALKSLSAYVTLMHENEDAPEELQQIVDEGLEAMKKLFVW